MRGPWIWLRVLGRTRAVPCPPAGPVAALLSMRVAQLLPLPVVCGVVFHASLVGKGAEALVDGVSFPLLLASAGDDAASLQPGGKIASLLESRFGKVCVVHTFQDMLHGWMVRGPLSDPAIRRDYEAGISLATQFFLAQIATSQ